jgi:hypothetical protein
LRKTQRSFFESEQSQKEAVQKIRSVKGPLKESVLLQGTASAAP